jgi:hypothetical protein
MTYTFNIGDRVRTLPGATNPWGEKVGDLTGKVLDTYGYIGRLSVDLDGDGQRYVRHEDLLPEYAVGDYVRLNRDIGVLAKDAILPIVRTEPDEIYPLRVEDGTPEGMPVRHDEVERAEPPAPQKGDTVRVVYGAVSAVGAAIGGRTGVVRQASDGKRIGVTIDGAFRSVKVKDIAEIVATSPEPEPEPAPVAKTDVKPLFEVDVLQGDGSTIRVTNVDNVAQIDDAKGYPESLRLERDGKTRAFFTRGGYYGFVVVNEQAA